MISPERLDIMQTLWVRFVESLGVSPTDAYRVFDRLVAAYTEPHRAYHNLEHIGEMLKVVGRLAKFATDTPSLILAVWFHDAVYDPQQSDNEERSADLAEQLLATFSLSDGQRRAIREMILATKHTSGHVTGDAALLVDADLAILGAGEARYDRYAAAIRQEYSHVPDEQYRPGRRAVLEKFLARPRIYHADILFQEAEAAARQNVSREIQVLAHPDLGSIR